MSIDKGTRLAKLSNNRSIYKEWYMSKKNDSFETFSRIF